MSEQATDLLPSSVRCPRCGVEHKAATGIGEGAGNQPAPGSVNICVDCGELAVYADDLTLRLPDLNEVMAMQKDAKNWQLITRAQEFIRARKGSTAGRRATV